MSYRTEKALAILTVLNGLQDLDLDTLHFGVVIGWSDNYERLTPINSKNLWALISPGKWWHADYEFGEVMVLKANGDEWYGDQRRPCKSSVDVEEFTLFENAMHRRNQALSVDVPK